MAGKKKKKSTKATAPKDNADTVVVQRAYEDSLKERWLLTFLPAVTTPRKRRRISSPDSLSFEMPVIGHSNWCRAIQPLHR